MKLFKILFAVVVAFSTLSCKKPSEGEENSGLTFVMSSRTNLIPVKQQSCEDEINGDPTVKSLSENSAKFSGIDFYWTGDKDLELQYINVTLTGAALDPSPQIVKMTFIGANPIILAAPNISTPTLYQLSCGIRLGGIKVKTGITSAKIKGKVEVYAISDYATSDSELVKSQMEISLDFKN